MRRSRQPVVLPVAFATVLVAAALCRHTSSLVGFTLWPSRYNNAVGARAVADRIGKRPTAVEASTLDVAPTSHLKQLADMTVLSIDTGDLDTIKKFASTGLITDATTNPLFVSQAGKSGDPTYVGFVDAAVAYAKEHSSDADEAVSLAIDRLAVNLGVEISKLVPGYVSTEVDPRLSFDKEATLARARRIIKMYEDAGVSRSRVLIKLAATWEGIQAMAELEKEGIRCNLTLVFGFVQAVACAQYGATLISPFPGRILDWHKREQKKDIWEPQEDPGVVAVRRTFNYYKKYGHDTICMPASWRPSRGKGYDLDEIQALAGVDRMTIPPGLLEGLASAGDALPQHLDATSAPAACEDAELCGGKMSEAQFRLLLNGDGCATEKTAEGLRSFIANTDELEEILRAKLAL
eukprot:TRINITY_DN29924_c0_g1_i1.p1 TRINITY_DN29924_c0_g1~~TRINITY_DN29924_c0_g1_i1.p1  ORF type:complete len:407 (+),score=67.55 TRINITY_DN29924_c0_g1_i1:70-1290(+)